MASITARYKHSPIMGGATSAPPYPPRGCLVIANLEEELKASAKLLRQSLTNKVYLDIFNRQMMGAWSEREYNKSGIYKYIKPTYTNYNNGGVMNYIFALGGTMEAFRNQLLTRRFSMLDARYLVGQYESDAITGYVGKGSVATEIRLTAGDEYYFGWKTQNGKLTDYQHAHIGGEAVFTYPDAMSQNDPIRLIGASRIRKIDFATTAPYLQGAWNFNTSKQLEEVVARVEQGNPSPWFMQLRGISGLRRIDLTGQSSVSGTEGAGSTEFDVSTHSGLRELLLGGTAVRSVRIAGGSPITRLVLPRTLTSLRLVALPELRPEGLTLEDWASVRTLWLSACPHLDWQTLVGRCTNLERLRVEGVDFEDDGTLLSRLATMRGVGERGEGVETCSLIGRCQLSRYVDDETLRSYREHFPSLDIRQPQYTVIEIDDNVADPANMSNLDNQTGYKYGTAYQVSGHLQAIISGIHRVLGKQSERGLMHVIQLHDDDSTKYADKPNYLQASPAKVDGSEGDVWTLFPAYYYKGVNDILNNKKWAVFSTLSQPSSPEGRKITGSELRQLEIPNASTYAYGKTLSECLRYLTSTEGLTRCFPVVAKIPVEGYKRINLPATDSWKSMGVVFLDADDRKIESVQITEGANNYLPGMNLICTIPEGAKYVLTTYPSICREDAVVWLTNSDNPADWEPDWVYSPEGLVGTLPTINLNGKLRSAMHPSVTQTNVYDYVQSYLDSLESRGEIKSLDYERCKNLINLRFYSLGTRKFKFDIDRRHINTFYPEMLSIGMHIPLDAPSHRGQYYISRGVSREHVSYVENYLGLANFTKANLIYLDKIHTEVKGATQNDSHIWFGRNTIHGIVDERYQRMFLADWHGGNDVGYTYHGRYMDLASVNGDRTPLYNRTTERYGMHASCDGYYGSRWHAFRPDIESLSGFAFLDEMNEPNLSRLRAASLSIRLMYEGKIVKLQDPEQYEQITMKY